MTDATILANMKKQQRQTSAQIEGLRPKVAQLLEVPRRGHDFDKRKVLLLKKAEAAEQTLISMGYKLEDYESCGSDRAKKDYIKASSLADKQVTALDKEIPALLREMN